MKRKSLKNLFAVIECRKWIDSFGTEYYTLGIAIYDTKTGYVNESWVTRILFGRNYHLIAENELKERGYEGLKYGLVHKYVIKRDLRKGM